MEDKIREIRDDLAGILARLDGLLEARAGHGAELEPSAANPDLPDDFPLLKALLESVDWPEAVFAAQIADEASERDKAERGEAIAEIMLPPYAGKKFLDFGCGEGHVARHVSKEASLSVGYDINKPSESAAAWEERQGSLLLTTDFERVRLEGPYDLVLLYDVVDHCECDPAELLKSVESVLAPEGKAIMRCHPWCGRHGGHIYRKINRAFVHLVFSEDELRELGVEPEHNNKVLKPLVSYTRAIEASGLKKEGEAEIDSQEVEDFFRSTPLVRDRILSNWGVDEWKQDPPQFQMSQCFLDYVLKKK